jgi:hypothetical protein
MVSYYITAPKMQGDVWVVEIKEYHGWKTTRTVTIRLEQALPFIKCIFHGILHKDIKDKELKK